MKKKARSTRTPQPIRATLKKEARPIVLTVRLSEDEHRRFQVIAAKKGLSLASLVRMGVFHFGEAVGGGQ